MSSYRDDTQETAVARDSVWLGLASLTEEVARTTTALVFGLMVLHTDAAVASDAAWDQPGAVIVEHAVASDAVVDALGRHELIIDRASIADSVVARLRVLHQDAAQVGDVFLERTRAMVVERAMAGEQVLAQRRVRSLVDEDARAGDSAPTFGASLVQDAAAAADSTTGMLRAQVLVSEGAAIDDELLDARHSQTPAVEQARAAAQVLDHLRAADVVREDAAAGDEVLGQEAGGQAWTADADGWAMSRYSPLQFASLVVIDGALYGLASDGVYALDTPTVQAAVIQTARVDVGKGVLVHPLQAFLEYALEGDTAALDVTTTQTGAAQTYSYLLEPELAGEQTNGRFKFGLGLRGTHFAFTLRLNAARGEVFNLSVDAAPTKRRV
jgi:hypothetical protein